MLSKCTYATFTHQEIILIKNLRCDVTKLPRYSAATAHERTIKIRFTSDYVTQVRAVARMREQSSFSTLRLRIEKDIAKTKFLDVKAQNFQSAKNKYFGIESVEPTFKLSSFNKSSQRMR